MSLTFVRPVSQADIDRVGQSVEVMEFLGGLQKHAVLFCATPTVHARVTEMASRLRSVCPNVMVECLPREPEPIGPFGAFNTIFRDSVEIVAQRVQTPWMWMEADVDPIRGGYADRLELEYHQKGQPFMGVRRKASEVMRNMDGTALPENDPRAQGDYMVAVGIYPPNFKDYSTLYKYPEPGGRMPTDVNIRHEINRHLHHTQLIGHHWNTGNYHRNAQGRIVCEDLLVRDGYPVYGGEVSEMAFVVHGCKDGSLAKLILSETPGNVSAMPITLTGNSGDAEMAALRLENEAMRADIQRMSQNWAAKENSYAAEIEELKERLAGAPVKTVSGQGSTGSEKDNPDTTTEKPLPTLEKVKTALREVNKKVQLASLAADFGCNKKALRELLQTDPSIQIAPGGLAWVSLAA